MIVVPSSLVPVPILKLRINQVGIYSIFSDDKAVELQGLPARTVPDQVQFPLSFKTEIDSDKSTAFYEHVFDENVPLLIAGPCAAEDENQIEETAKFIKSEGLNFFRAGCFKPRTNAYSFQGLGETGLKICREACDRHGLRFVTEVKTLSNLDPVMDYADVVQVGSKCMYDTGVLKTLGRGQLPVLLKRHFGASLKEFIQAADFILSEGNENVVLCERGIRTFESSTRFTLDSCGVEWLKFNSWLPVIGDPSHALGSRYGVTNLGIGLIAQGISGLIVEVHPNPKEAKSDAAQQLSFDEFQKFNSRVRKLMPLLIEFA